MEDPRGWNLITACLAVSSLEGERIAQAWRFLVAQGLCRDAPGDEEVFRQAVGANAHDITGPSRSYRVAAALGRAGLLHAAAREPDPEGAKARMLLRAWVP